MVISASIAEKFKSRLQRIDSWIESAMGEASKCLGQLKVNIVVDEIVDTLFFKALEGVRHGIILGMDFIKNETLKLKISKPFGELVKLFCRMEHGIRSAIVVQTV